MACLRRGAVASRHDERHDPRTAAVAVARPARRAGREDGRLRRLGHADRVRRHRVRAPGRPRTGRAVRRLPHGEGDDRRPGCVDLPQRPADQRPAADRGRPGPVHDAVRRGRRRRRRPDRVPAGGRRGARRPERGQRRRRRRCGPRGSSARHRRHRPARGSRDRGGPGTPVAVAARRARAADLARLHALRRRGVGRRPRDRLPDRVHRRARLRAGGAVGRGGAGVGRPAGPGPPLRRRARGSRGAGHATDRDGLPVARQ